MSPEHCQHRTKKVVVPDTHQKEKQFWHVLKKCPGSAHFGAFFRSLLSFRGGWFFTLPHQSTLFGPDSLLPMSRLKNTDHWNVIIFLDNSPYIKVHISTSFLVLFVVVFFSWHNSNCLTCASFFSFCHSTFNCCRKLFALLSRLGFVWFQCGSDFALHCTFCCVGYRDLFTLHVIFQVSNTIFICEHIC